MNSSKVKFNSNQSSSQPKINSSNNNNNNNNNNSNNTAKYNYNNRNNKRSIKSNARFKNKSKHNNNFKNKEEVTKLLDLNSTNHLSTTSTFINATVVSTSITTTSSLPSVAAPTTTITTTTPTSLVHTKKSTNEDACNNTTICSSQSNDASILPSATTVTSITRSMTKGGTSSLPAMTATIPSTTTTTTTTTPNASTTTQTTNVPLKTLAVIPQTSTTHTPMIFEDDTSPSSNGSVTVSVTNNKQSTNLKQTVTRAVKRSALNGERSASQIPRKKLKNGINGSTTTNNNNNTNSNVQVAQPKNTVAMLNELRQGLIYNLESQSGPVHAPIFTMTVEVDGQIYNGQGRSKKIARIQAAAAALRSFIQFKDGAVLSPLKSVNNVDFTSDEHIDNGIVPPKINKLVELMQNKIVQIKTNTFSNGQKQVPEKGPVMLLYELFNDVHIECASNDGAQHSRFKMIATVNDQKFEGTGPSKKLAKNAAAKAALAALCDISYSPMQAAQQQQQNEELPRNDFNKKDSYELPQTFADAIGKLVLDKFSQVTVGIENYSRRKVLAGIVMIENYDLQKAKVISVSTGTKCINGEHMSVNGAVLNDSHAEIVSRRCLVDFLYSQLEMLINHATAKDSIFIRSMNFDQLYKVKDGIRFHLYINTAPCGDARIFSPHEDDMGVDKHPNRKARGQLRTKIESGEGTIPVKSSDGIQTWDGVLQGQRLLTMSCSDKIARWNVVGLQGALLSSIIQPIYLDSIVLGSLLHPAHMFRAVCGRIESAIQGLPPPYCLNKPKFALVTSAETRNQIKAPNFGINWTIGLKDVEVVNSLTGKTVNGKISRITKQTFFNRYANLIKKLPIIKTVKRRTVIGDYGETKSAVKDYQIAKQELFAAFRREDLGNWLKKPIEQDQFFVAE